MAEERENPIPLSDADLQKSYWFLTHRDPMKRKATYVLAFFSCGISIFAIIWGISIFISDLLIYNSMKKVLLEGRLEHSSKPLIPNLTISDSGVLLRNDETIDAFASVSNQTVDWQVTCDVIFRAGPFEKAVPLILYPGDTRYALLLAQTVPSQALMENSIANIQWKRLSSNEKKILKERRNFQSQNSMFTPYDPSRIDSPPYAALKFDFTNESVYGFWEIRIPVIVFSNSQVVGVHQLIVPNIKPREKRALEVRWTTGVPLAPQTPTFVLEPIIDIFQKDLYQPQEGVLQY